MERKFYNVYYNNVNVEGELKVSKMNTTYSDNDFIDGYFVKEFKQEPRYRKKEVKGFWGTKTINEEYFVTVGSGKLMTYVEEIDGKYYDIITGTEAISEISNFYIWEYVQKIGDECYSGNEKLNKDLVESKKLKFCQMKKATIEEMYKFLKSLTDRDIELYHQRMMQALNNIDKIQKQRMSKVSQEANKRKEQEDYVRNFIENNGFGRNRTR
ncbi:MAG: hypothetical protein Q4C23_02105 [Mycoplasmatota bacterium]|nr:hypothetical protein [Mycoplasmatota bacterium]